MMAVMVSRFDKPLSVLLRDYGYRVAGNEIISMGIRGFTSDRRVGTCRDLFDAAETLLPIISDEEFTARFHKITAPLD